MADKSTVENRARRKPAPSIDAATPLEDRDQLAPASRRTSASSPEGNPTEDRDRPWPVSSRLQRVRDESLDDQAIPIRQPHMVYSRPSPIPLEVLNAAMRWVARERSHLFVMTASSNPQVVELSRRFVDEVYKHRAQFKIVRTLDILLNHGAGEFGAAYHLVNFFRRHCKKLRIFVPCFANSVATLLALGADEIWMSAIGELSPIDVQIPNPREPGELTSALESFSTMNYLRAQSSEIFDEFIRLLDDRTSLPTKAMLDIASEHTARMMHPLYGNLDPLHLGYSHRAMEASREYGRRVMSRYAYGDYPARRIDTRAQSG
jgi:hypothetical protein